MTSKANIALAELAEKGGDTDLLREMIQYVAQRMMDMEVEGLCAAAYGERNPERLNSRNGYRERLWETRNAQRPSASSIRRNTADGVSFRKSAIFLSDSGAVKVNQHLPMSYAQTRLIPSPLRVRA